MTLAPIAFFAYKRPEHTLRALEALSQCELAEESRLFIYCDGAKKAEDMEIVEKVREIAASRKWCGTVEVIAREENAGLANSIIAGVTELCNKYGKIIVLEDDLVVSPWFLRYMNDALQLYSNEEAIMQISGYMFDVEITADTDAIFLPFTTSWGWGTWQRAWRKFDSELSGYDTLKKDMALRRAFDLDGNFNYFSMLEKRVSGLIDSWAIQWYLSVFMCKGLVLHPLKSFISNRGFDGSGTNYIRSVNGKESTLKPFSTYDHFRFPSNISESIYKNKVIATVTGVDSTSLILNIKSKLKKTLNKLKSRL